MSYYLLEGAADLLGRITWSNYDEDTYSAGSANNNLTTGIKILLPEIFQDNHYIYVESRDAKGEQSGFDGPLELDEEGYLVYSFNEQTLKYDGNIAFQIRAMASQENIDGQIPRWLSIYKKLKVNPSINAVNAFEPQITDFLYNAQKALDTINALIPQLNIALQAAGDATASANNAAGNAQAKAQEAAEAAYAAYQAEAAILATRTEIINQRDAGEFNGPNLLTENTATTLTGMLKAAGNKVAAAVAGTDYISPAEKGVLIATLNENLKVIQEALKAVMAKDFDPATGTIQQGFGAIDSRVSGIEEKYESKLNKVTSISLPDNIKYPTTLLLKTLLDDKVNTSTVGVTLATLNASLQVVQEALSAITAKDFNTTAGTIKTNFSNISSAISALQTAVMALQGGVIPLGIIELNVEDVTQVALNARALELRPTIKDGYTLTDLDNHEWRYVIGTETWVDTGVYKNNPASNEEFGVVKGNEYVSIISGLMQILKADKATSDASGNNIINTYATKNALAEVAGKINLDDVLTGGNESEQIITVGGVETNYIKKPDALQVNNTIVLNWKFVWNNESKYIFIFYGMDEFPYTKIQFLSDNKTYDIISSEQTSYQEWTIHVDINDNRPVPEEIPAIKLISEGAPVLVESGTGDVRCWDGAITAVILDIPVGINISQINGVIIDGNMYGITTKTQIYDTFYRFDLPVSDDWNVPSVPTLGADVGLMDWSGPTNLGLATISAVYWGATPTRYIDYYGVANFPVDAPLTIKFTSGALAGQSFDVLERRVIGPNAVQMKISTAVAASSPGAAVSVDVLAPPAAISTSLTQIVQWGRAAGFYIYDINLNSVDLSSTKIKFTSGVLSGKVFDITYLEEDIIDYLVLFDIYEGAAEPAPQDTAELGILAPMPLEPIRAKSFIQTESGVSQGLNADYLHGFQIDQDLKTTSTASFKSLAINPLIINNTEDSFYELSESVEGVVIVNSTIPMTISLAPLGLANYASGAQITIKNANPSVNITVRDALGSTIDGNVEYVLRYGVTGVSIQADTGSGKWRIIGTEISTYKLDAPKQSLIFGGGDKLLGEDRAYDVGFLDSNIKFILPAVDISEGLPAPRTISVSFKGSTINPYTISYSDNVIFDGGIKITNCVDDYIYNLLFRYTAEGAKWICSTTTASATYIPTEIELSGYDEYIALRDAGELIDGVTYYWGDSA